MVKILKILLLSLLWLAVVLGHPKKALAQTPTGFPEIIFLVDEASSPESSSRSQLAKLGLDLKDFVLIDSYLNPELALEKALQEKQNIIFKTHFSDLNNEAAFIERLRSIVPSVRLTLIDLETPLRNTDLVSGDDVNQKAQSSRIAVTQLNHLFNRFIKVRSTDKANVVFARAQDNTWIKNKDSLSPHFFDPFPHLENSSPIDIIFDIDWTLTYDVPETYQGHDNIFTHGKNYRPADGAAETIYAYSQMPNVRVSFFSGERTLRNEDLLNSIRLPNGKTAYEVAYQILSKPDLSLTGSTSTIFSKKYAKDLTKVDPAIDLGRAVIIEDIKDFVPVNQRPNVLWLGATYTFYGEYPEALDRNADKFAPPTRKDWALERNKLYWAFGAIVSAIHKSQTTSTNMVSALNAIQTDHGAWVDRTDDSQLPYYLKAHQFLSALISGFLPLTPLNRVEECVIDVTKVNGR